MVSHAEARVSNALIRGCLAVAIVAFSQRARGDEPAKPAEVASPPRYETFLVIPLRVHILSADELPDVDCKLRDEDATRILGKVNGIWNKAGIHWGLDALVREPAAEAARFKRAHELDGPRNLGLYKLLVPDSSRAGVGMHVYYIHKFAVNGVWLGGGTAFVQETARLRPVEGGIDEPVPRVTSHELGHALGLPHRENRTNLLASGTTGTTLNTAEIEMARAKARTIEGVKTVADFKTEAEAAEASGDRARARAVWTWLGQIPDCGDAPKEALARLDEKTGR